MSTKPSDANGQVDADGFNTMIKWTVVQRGRKKSASYHPQRVRRKYGGISEMRKEEEKGKIKTNLNVQNLPGLVRADLSHDSSHHDLLAPLPDNFMKYTRMIKEQLLQEW